MLLVEKNSRIPEIYIVTKQKQMLMYEITLINTTLFII